MYNQYPTINSVLGALDELEASATRDYSEDDLDPGDFITYRGEVMMLTHKDSTGYWYAVPYPEGRVCVGKNPCPWPL